MSPPQSPVLVIAMGVSGTGKSTLGRALAEALELPFIDGDDLHPASNIAKMSAGQPLNDLDREPWLRIIRKTAQNHISEVVAAGKQKKPGVVMACSALRKYYRDILRGDLGSNEGILNGNAPTLPFPTFFVFIDGSRELLMDRMQKRTHFMKAEMLDSQLNTLENPAGEEGVVVVSAEDSTEIQVKQAVDGLEKLWK